MPNSRPLHNLNEAEILEIKQLTSHPGWAAFNKLLLYQVESETADFVGRDLIDDKEIVNRYKDLRGVHKAVGQTLTVIKLLVETPKVEDATEGGTGNPFDLPEYRPQI
ncbi:Uncharacterised protein [uncultured archaeon]|nr:Uncharacterised protein [uncultured archaeon]